MNFLRNVWDYRACILVGILVIALLVAAAAINLTAFPGEMVR